MREAAPILFLTFAMAAVLPAVTKRDTARRSFTVDASGRSLEVDNLFGDIRVTAQPGNTIEMTAQQDIEAGDNASLQNALRDVKLEISQNGNAVRICVDGPFRDRHRDHWDDHYRVLYNFELRVPPETALKLKTVNDGVIAVTGVAGSFDIRNVNGRIDLKEIGGSGYATTVNGPVAASFRQIPNGPWKFKTVNGSLETSFPNGFGADVHAKTMNGDLYTDFEVTQPASKPAALESGGTRRRWRSDRGGNVRIGGGGPEFSYETLNGDIRILKRGS